MTGMLSLVLSACVAAAPEHSEQPFDHDDWTGVLERFVDERGRVDYKGLAADREVLDRYLAAIEASSPATDPSRFAGRAAELAYYVNAYNALVFAGVLDRGPEEKSVWTGLGPSGFAFFVMKKFKVGGRRTSLKALEDGIVRKRYEDPRVHAALNCASLGCPRLPREAFEASRLDEQLDAAMREFVSDERNVRVDERARTVTLSKIFDWFRDDFLDWEQRQGTERPTLLDYVNRYRPAGAAVPPDYEIRFSEYDKRLNSL